MDEIPRPYFDAIAIFVQNNPYSLLFPFAIITGLRLGILPLDLFGRLTQHHELQPQLPPRSLTSSDLDNNVTERAPFPSILADFGKIQNTVNETKVPSSPNVPWPHIFGYPNTLCYSPAIAVVGAQTIEDSTVATATAEVIDNLTVWEAQSPKKGVTLFCSTYSLVICTLIYLLSTFSIIFYFIYQRHKAPAAPEIPPENTEYQSLVAQLQRDLNGAIKDRDDFRETLENHQSSAAEQTEKLKRELRNAESEIEQLNGAHSEHLAECLSRSYKDSHHKTAAEKRAESAENLLAQERATRQSLWKKLFFLSKRT